MYYKIITLVNYYMKTNVTNNYPHKNSFLPSISSMCIIIWNFNKNPLVSVTLKMFYIDSY